MSEATELLDKAKNARERAVAALDERDDLHAAMLREICPDAPSADGYLRVMGAFFSQADTSPAPTPQELVGAAIIVTRLVASLYSPSNGETAIEWARRSREHLGNLLRAELNGQRRG